VLVHDIEKDNDCEDSEGGGTAAWRKGGKGEETCPLSWKIFKMTIAPCRGLVTDCMCLLFVQECYGMKLLVIREPAGGLGKYTVMDAHCFHMGMPLVGGDIEDLGEHSCIVCPAHRYKIDMKTGCKVDTDLDGHVCGGGEQKQRLYNVHCDSEFVWVDIPAHPGKELASDKYNQHHRDIMMSQNGSTRGFGLFGPAPGTEGAVVPPGSPLQPYAGSKGWPAGSPAPTTAEEPMDLSQPSQESPRNIVEMPQRRRLDFAEVKKPESARTIRRKAATQAILKKSYKPPTGSQPLSTENGGRQKTLFESWNRSAGSGVTVQDDMVS